MKAINFFTFDEKLPISRRTVLLFDDDGEPFLSKFIDSFDKNEEESFLEEDEEGNVEEYEDRYSLEFEGVGYDLSEYLDTFWCYIDELRFDLYKCFPYYDFNVLLETKEAVIVNKKITSVFQRDAEDAEVRFFDAEFRWNGCSWFIHANEDDYNDMHIMGEHLL